MNHDAYKELQHTVHKVVSDIGNSLRPGHTEIEVCERVQYNLKKYNIDQYFHLPFVWFGDRSGFENFKRPFSFLSPAKMITLPHFGKEFFPTEKQLEENMPFIIDVAPIQGEVMIDMGMSFYHGENKDFNFLKGHLSELRSNILTSIQDGSSIAQTYEKVDAYLKEHGLRNCHDLYPLGVLGHKIIPLTASKFLNSNYMMRFNLNSFLALAKSKKEKQNDLIQANVHHSFTPGLWAIEPHIATGSIGAKFEEILVIEENNVFWLDDRIPEIRGY